MTAVNVDAAGDLLLGRHHFQIRLARVADGGKPSIAPRDRPSAARPYLSKGQQDHSASMLRRVTLRACDRSQTFGTVDVCFDSEVGLPADTIYAAEIDHYRTSGARVAQVTRLAVDPQFGSEELLGALFHVAFIFMNSLYNVSDIFVEVHPRHAELYQHMLNLRPAGECKLSSRVDAPAVLLHVRASYVREQIALSRRAQGNAQSLYRYFCSEQEEAEVIRRASQISRAC